KYEGKDETTVEREMDAFHPTDTLKDLQGQIQSIRNQVDEVMDPLLVIQGEQDQMINTDSANIIYNESDSDDKELKWYANSGHRSEEHTSELQSRFDLVCRLLLD